MAVLVGLFSALLVLNTEELPADATPNPPNTDSVGGNTFFAYVTAGETLDVEFAKTRTHSGSGSDVRFDVISPTGSVEFSCTIDAGEPNGTTCGQSGLSGPAGVWKIQEVPLSNVNTGTYLRATSATRFAWDIDVQASGSTVPGRVWTDLYMGYDSSGSANFDLDFWAITEFGAMYSLSLDGFTGGGWSLDANAFGIVEPDTCNSLYRSTVMTSNSARYQQAGPECGRAYWLFFEEPAADLPVSAPSADGEMVIVPPVAAPAITDLAYQPAAGGTAGGELSWTLANFIGSYELRIDTDGDGDFDGPQDRTIQLGGSSGAHTYAWDGLDGNGEAVDACLPMSAELRIDRADELHFVLADVEGLTGGIEVRQLRGNSAGRTTLFWDDTTIPTAGKTSTTPIVDGTGGIDSAGGTHEWPNSGGNPWGNQAALDHWTYSDVDVREEIDLDSGCIEVTKTSDATADARPGDVVTYEVTATNTGTADYTVDEPAHVLDDLTGVLDDAVYNGDLSADSAGVLAFDSPRLSWSGPLAAGETVTLTYSVTLGAGGDGTVRNVAWSPFDPEDPTPTCEDAVDGRDPETGVPCATDEYLMPKLRIAKSADRDELPAIGEIVEYTVTVTNEGPGAYTATAPATFTDDLSDVLDAADYNDDATASSGTVSTTLPELSWEGALAAGESVTVTYSVTYNGEGDQHLRNTACIPATEAAQSADACDFTTVPGSGLTQWKRVQSTDDPVVAGSILTYTLFFKNDGEATALVDAIDDLTHVSDDADVIVEPTVSDPSLTATRTGDRIAIEGTVASDATVSITYQVQVRPDGERGDDIASNFLLSPDEETPDDPVCEPTDEQLPDCTTTPIAAITYRKAVEASSDPVVEGTVLTYTVTIDSTGAAAAPVAREDVLTDVLDDADLTTDPVSDTASVTVGPLTGERFAIGGTLGAGETATVSYQVTVRAPGERGNDTATNFLVPNGGQPSAECLEGDEQCTTTPMPSITWDKSSDPDSGTEVGAGDQITYTLTFRNDGTAAGPVDHTDHLVDVLDDAAVTSEPAVSGDGVTADRDGDRITIAGTLGAGDTATVTYAVTVGADGERGDNQIGNVLAPSSLDDPSCEDEGAVCTGHPITELRTWKTVEADRTPVVAGTVLTYTLHFDSIGAASAAVDHVDDLTHVSDDADVTTEPTSDALDVGRDGDRIVIAGTLAGGESTTVTYQVTVRPDGERGDDLAVNFLLDADGEPPADPVCEPADPAYPMCTSTPIGELVTAKAVSADSDPVVAGSVLTYTLTFDNPGRGPVAVDHTDVLSDVLDDADPTGEIEVSDPSLSVERGADALLITGELAGGTSATVTYRVQVKDEADRGNDTADNFLVPTGTEPPPRGSCEVDDPNCTTTPLPNIGTTKSSDPESGAPVEAGQEIVYTLTFTNSGKAAGPVAHLDHLTGVLDDADLSVEPVSDAAGLTVTRDGELIGITGSLGAGETATVTYTVTVRPDGERGDHVLTNFLLREGVEPPAECLAEDPNCVRHPVGYVTPAKSVDPESGTTVDDDRVLTYTLTFRNDGQGTAGVDFTDHLAGVLDDAAWMDEVTATTGLTVAGPEDGRLAISGELAAGETGTVTYRVRVKPHAEQGDHLLGNFLTPAGEGPPTECVADSDLCTVNPTEAPPEPPTPPAGPGSSWLPRTGGEYLATAVVGALLLAAGGVLMTGARRRFRIR